EGVVVATVIRPGLTAGVEAGERLWWGAEGVAGGSLRGSPLEAALAGVVRTVFRERSHRLAHLGSAEVFVEYVAPPQRLVVLGAGPDVVPLVAMAAVLGWEVTVADRPSAPVQPRRFPGAHRVLALPEPGNLEALELDAGTAVVVMTHNYPLDRLLLPALLAHRPRYLGMLGPRPRAERLFGEIDEDLARWDVHAPVGLDIGSDHPETVALAILAEIQAALAGRSGGPLRDREGPIHGAAWEWGTAVSRGGEPGEAVLASCETRAMAHHA
ncbi:MAG: XdhC family protein, partial [Verrucomicrobiota bacterium]